MRLIPFSLAQPFFQPTSGDLTLSATGSIPVASIGLVLGVHRLLSSAFVPVNVLGNALATIVMSRWERALDVKALHSQLHYPRPSPLKEDRNLR